MDGPVHKRMRRVSNLAFSFQDMGALVPVAFGIGLELRDKWFQLLDDDEVKKKETGDSDEKSVSGAKLDVYNWVGRATFDIIGLAGI